MGLEAIDWCGSRDMHWQVQPDTGQKSWSSNHELRHSACPPCLHVFRRRTHGVGCVEGRKEGRRKEAKERRKKRRAASAARD